MPMRMDAATLKDADAFERRLMQGIDQFFWATNRDCTRVIYLSPRFEEVFGIWPERLMANAAVWLDVVVPEDVERCREWLENVSKDRSAEVEYRIFHPQRGIRWIRSRSFPFVDERGVPMQAGIGEDITDRKRAEQAKLERAIMQRDALVREVHHRIKNNLQTVIGLLRREARAHPLAREPIEAAIVQVQSVAVVHGLQGRAVKHDIMLCELLPAIVGNVAELTSVPIIRKGVGEGYGELCIKESETVAVALMLNELIMNAVKHSHSTNRDVVGQPLVTMTRENGSGQVKVSNPGKLPAGFDFDSGSGLGTGLGLVRALLPENGASIRFESIDGHVVVELSLAAPVLMSAPRDHGQHCLRQVYEATDDRR